MREALDRLLVGRTLAARYRVEALIGTGGMSVVYRAHDETLGRPVAVKVVSLDAASEDERERLRARFRREAGSAARIPAHPNVVQIHDFGTDPEIGLDFIVMELLEGRDLKQAMADGPVPVVECVRILRETARGLAAGHRVGIVHRDVKPANVFLVGGDEDLEGVRVLDFGIAKPMEAEEGDDLTRTGQAPHSPAYAAPEQTDTRRAISPASDVYSLGLIAYEMLSGERPFNDGDRARIRGGAQLPLPERGRWPSVPRALRSVVERALRAAPEERWADGAEVAEALAAVPDAELTQTIVAPSHPRAEDDTHLAVTVAPRAVPIPVPASAQPPSTPLPETEFQPVPENVVRSSPTPFDPHAPARPTRIPRPAVIGILLVLLALLAVWMLGRRHTPRTGDAALPDSVQLTGLDDEFLRLQGAIATAQPTAHTTPRTAPAPSGGDQPPASAAAAMPFDPAREQAVIQQAVVDLHQAWVQGDLARMMSHYAAEVHFHERSTSNADQVRSEIGQLLAKYPLRTVTLNQQAITFPEPDQAKALVDREWNYQGPSDHWTGRDRLLLIFHREGSAWKITTERRQTTYRSRHRRI